MKIASIGFLLLACTAARAGAPDQLPPAPSLAQLADLDLSTTTGAKTRFGSISPLGRATVVSFWATWCAPCNAEAKHLADLRARYPEARLNILAINVDSRRDPAKLAAFLTRTGAGTLHQYWGDAATYRALTSESVIRLPRLFVFAADGTPRARFGRYFGGRTLNEIDAAVAAVAGKPEGGR